MKKILLIAALFLSISYTSNAQEPMLAEVKLFAGNFAPRGWAFCHGQLLPITQHQALFSLLGTTYGGDGRTTFALPDLRGRAAIGAGEGKDMRRVLLGQRNSGIAVKANTDGSDWPKTKPTLGLNYIIALQGIFPSRN